MAGNHIQFFIIPVWLYKPRASLWLRIALKGFDVPVVASSTLGSALDIRSF